MMKTYPTTRFGNLSFEEGDILRFPEGIPGFEVHTQWVLAGEENDPIKWLQSLSDGSVALPVTTPDIAASGYNAKLPKAELERLEMEKVEDLAVLIVLSIPAFFWETTANLCAPIVINTKKRLGRQIIAENEEYGLKHNIWDDAARRRMAEENERLGRSTASASNPEGQ